MNAQAEEVLLAYLYPRTREDMSAEQQVAFEQAVLDQAAFMQKQGGNTPVLRQAAVGDVRVTYAEASGRHGSVAPEVYGRLLRCGLLNRWV